ncbi:Helix-turn-helix domain-containing protein [Rhodoblastus acidophilus]|uniref:Helix-turn-helix domain-containing protein n=1 Tax=Rhodoblastus acidophilus TaxID=1074 RepID=A0A212SCG9_RHOAC|nr:helix-turn-helix transcriptional regulator [Rhodoblastus acidophilus]PPQ35344.1 XRE family transcriptional regulator [Rhodoblastus acidophilus]RAI16968.1 XRE family transcriptional regulator [Rhodoblastus acidophilus]SNB83260.1 Helix-turn-helix domain-containing protein [Rhodoblastus acidophilus]
MSRQIEIGKHLAVLREQAGLKQNELARRIEWSAAVLSRVETGERALSDEELVGILNGIGSPDALKVQNQLARQWVILPEPSLSDVDADLLWEAEQAAQKIHELAESPDVKQFFERRLVRYKEELLTAAARVAEKRYRVAFIGTIAAGKSTAICRAERLELPTLKGMPKAVLETGSGGITICEVHLRRGPGYGLIIEPCPEDELRQHVTDYANVLLNTGRSALAADDPDNDGSSTGISREVARALRNMAGLKKRRTEKKPDGTIVPGFDDERTLAEAFPEVKALCIELLDRMELHKRDRRDLWHVDTTGRSPLEWLQEKFELVNNGRHPEFTLPKRIELVLPSSILGDDALSVTLIDTQGIDDAERADLEQHFDDPHSIVVLCSVFNEAPQVQIRGLLKRAQEGGVRTLGSHVGILVLPRPGDALNVKDNGFPVATAEEGYIVKGEEVELKLQPLGLKDLPTFFFNSAEDDPDTLRRFIRDRISAVREYHRNSVRQIIADAHALLANYEREQAAEIMRAAARRLEVWLTTNTKLNERPTRHVQDSLLAAIGNAHPRSIAASIVRAGEWPNLDYSHQLSHGARRVATQLIQPKLIALKEVAENLLQDDEMADAFDLIRQCLRAAEAGFDKMVRKVQLVGQSIHADEMRLDVAFWQACECERGRGYRDRIKEKNNSWFSDANMGEGDKRVVSLIQEAWDETIASVRALITHE